VTARVDGEAPDDGRLGVRVTTDPGAAVSWSLLDQAGEVVSSGGAVADDEGVATVDRDVPEGDFRLAVDVTDAFDRTTSTSLGASVAPDPWSFGRTLLVVGGMVGAGLLLVILLVPAVPFLVRLGTRAHARWTAWRIGRASHRFRLAELLEVEDVELWEDELQPEPAPAVVPAQRSRHEAVETLLQVANDGSAGGSLFPLGLALVPDERILHSTSGHLYESADDSDELVLVEHDGEVVVTNRRIVFVGDVTRDWWTGLIDEIEHVGDDRTVLRRWREDSWSGVVYDDAEVTRLYVDMLVAEQHGTRDAYLSRLQEELRGERPSQAVGGRD
jgi:hypothetical protein